MGASRTCNSYKWVNVKGQGRSRRCADYTVHRGRYAKKRRGKKTRYKAKRRRPFNKGKTCVEKSMHYSKRARRLVPYCASWGASPEWRKKRGRKGRRGMYREGDFPGSGYLPGARQPSVMDRLRYALIGKREAELSGLGRYGRRW